MKLKWIGKYDGTNLPTADLPPGAKALPEITAGSAWMLIPVLLVFALICFCKHRFLGGLAFNRLDWMIGVGLGLLFCPVHELLHAVCFPPESDVFFFYTGMGLGMTCTAPVTRSRALFINLLPAAVLGGLSLILFLAVPAASARLSTILCAFCMIHLGGSYADYLNVIHLLKLPRSAVVQISGAAICWWEP